jgi:competence protein ComEA
MRPKKVEMAVIAVTIAFVFFTAGYFVGRQGSSGAVQLPPSIEETAVAGDDATGAPPPAITGNTPAKDEPDAPPAAESTSAPAAPQEKIDGKININVASLSTLQELSGVGPAIAGRIVDYRETKGPYKTIADIKNVKGIGEKTYEKLKDLITVG